MDALIISVYAAMEAKEGKIKIPRNKTADFDAEREELLSHNVGHSKWIRHPQHLGCQYLAERPEIYPRLLIQKCLFVDVI